MSSSAPSFQLGPCSPWITGADVAASGGAVSVPEGGAGEFDTVAAEASSALFEISGRQFNGICERHVRPCSDSCGCFGMSPSLALGPWYWANTYAGLGGGWGWYDECTGNQCGCGALSRIRLAGYPVQEITAVHIDGNLVDPSTYRLDGYRWLIRMADPGPPVVDQMWPNCQNLALNDDQPGTFSVDYTFGIAPPQLGKDAACQIAYQLWLASSGEPNVLPQGITKTVRQGVTTERGLWAQWFDPSSPTGLSYVDLFLRSYWRDRTVRRPAVWSPDVQQFAKKIGNA